LLILVKSPAAARRVTAGVVRFVEGKLKLLVSPAKSRVAHLSQCTFPGFRIQRGKIRWSPQAVEDLLTDVQEFERSPGILRGSGAGEKAPKMILLMATYLRFGIFAGQHSADFTSECRAMKMKHPADSEDRASAGPKTAIQRTFPISKEGPVTRHCGRYSASQILSHRRHLEGEAPAEPQLHGSAGASPSTPCAID
jgi:hypothetical protein